MRAFGGMHGNLVHWRTINSANLRSVRDTIKRIRRLAMDDCLRRAYAVKAFSMAMRSVRRLILLKNKIFAYYVATSLKRSLNLFG